MDDAAGAGDVPLIAKLERPLALEHLEEILDACDAVMVARGDLGLEMPLERVPRAQKDITRRARLHGIPVIVATQVLESMTTEARPTRAEVNDAANAVEDGVDAIMLAGETAAGAYPVRTVRTLNAIIGDAETAPLHKVPVELIASGYDDHARALCEAAVTLADRSAAQAIVAVTRGGTTARWLSALRPHAPIIAATEREDTARRLTLYWGVVPLCMPIGENLDEASARIGAQLVERGLGRGRHRRVRQHQRRPEPSRRELPQDPAAVMPDIRYATVGAVVLAFILAAVTRASRTPSSIASSSARHRRGREPRGGPRPRPAADARAHDAGVRRRRARQRLARARALRRERAAVEPAAARPLGADPRRQPRHHLRRRLHRRARGEPGDRSLPVQAGAAPRRPAISNGSGAPRRWAAS